MRKEMMVGYLESWGNISFTEAAKTGYNVLVLAFGEINNTEVRVFNNRFNPSPTPEKLKSDIAEAKKSGAEHILFSVGGGNNTYNPGDSSAQDLASSIISFLKEYGFTGIDFDLEIDTSTDYIDQLCAEIRKLDSDLLITAAPQFNQGPPDSDLFYVSSGNCQIYNKAIANKRFDYLFVQNYNNGWPKLKGYGQTDIKFISEAFMNLKKCTPPETLIAMGLPACKEGAGTSVFTTGNTPSDIYEQIAAQYKSISEDPQSGGAMCWDINWDKREGYKFVEAVSKAI